MCESGPHNVFVLVICVYTIGPHKVFVLETGPHNWAKTFLDKTLELVQFEVLVIKYIFLLASLIFYRAVGALERVDPTIG